MSLTIVDVGSPRVPINESDEYINLSLSWVSPDAVLDLFYYFVSDRDGGADRGYVEVKVDATDGEIAELVVVTLPSSVAAVPDVDLIESSSVDGLVRVDTSLWGATSSDYLSIVNEESVLSVGVAGDDVYLSLADADPVRWFVSGFVYFGIDVRDHVVGFLVRSGGCDPIIAERVAGKSRP